LNTIEGVLGDATPFLKKVFAALKKDNINVSEYELDHICYRVETVERYNELK
jgi:predicted metalloenzyme YecM